MDDDWFLLYILFFVMVLSVGIGIGLNWDKDILLTSYCQHQQGIYEQINAIDYCIVDNQLQEIEWVK